jgi:predicted DsbA family dithiol-disulfide isomerase
LIPGPPFGIFQDFGFFQKLGIQWHPMHPVRRTGGANVGGALEIIYDYVDPGSYLTFAVLERWLAKAPEYAPRVRWRPLELCQPGQPLLNPRDVAWAAMEEGLSVDATELGVRVRAPGQIPWSRKAHELALHAQEQAGGVFERVHGALFRAHFEESDDLSRVDRLVELASRCGLDPAEVRTVLGVDRFVEEVERERNAILGQGIRGVPTLRFAPDTDDERWLEGYQGIDILESALQWLEERGSFG